MSRKALILTWEKFQDHEVIYPYYALQEHGFEVTIAGGPNLGRIFGILGAHVVCDMLVEDLDPSLTDEYDLLVIPGGVKALEKLRLEEKAVEFTSKWMSEDKMTFAICNGPQLLITAECLNGRECAAYYSIEQDVKNAGATYNRHVCIDRNLISCSHYDFMGEWIRLGMESFTSYESN
jgi:protease I